MIYVTSAEPIDTNVSSVIEVVVKHFTTYMFSTTLIYITFYTDSTHSDATNSVS